MGGAAKIFPTFSVQGGCVCASEQEVARIVLSVPTMGVEVGVGAIPKVGQGPPDLGTGIHAATISNYYNAKPTKEVKFWNNHNTNHFQNKEETKI